MSDPSRLRRTFFTAGSCDLRVGAVAKKATFEMKLINPATAAWVAADTQIIWRKNPGGTIPCIEEPDSGFTLGEAHAILTYLAQKHAWTDLSESLQARGRIDAYLHYHHRNVRECSMLVAAKVRKDLNFSADMQDQSRRAIAGAMNVLDQQYLASSDYLFGDQPAQADPKPPVQRLHSPVPNTPICMTSRPMQIFLLGCKRWRRCRVMTPCTYPLRRSVTSVKKRLASKC